jgi:hypothetical protein
MPELIADVANGGSFVDKQDDAVLVRQLLPILLHSSPLRLTRLNLSLCARNLMFGVRSPKFVLA